MPVKLHPRRSFVALPVSLLALLALAGLPVSARTGPAGTGAAHPAQTAAEPWEVAAFTGDPAAIARAAAKVPGAEDDDVVVLLMEASYSFDEAGRETYTQRLVYRILAAGAHESWSTVEESWEPWHQTRPEIRARVITPDGAEHPLDPSTFTENSATRDAPDMFEDGRILRAPLPATRPGAVVEQQVTVRDTAPFFDGGVVRLHSLDPGMPLRHARITLEAPAGMPLRWVARELPGVSPREEVSAGRRRLTFEARDLEPADDPEPGLPPETPRSAYVAFSTGRSWADLARRYSEIVDRAIRGADISAFLRAASAGSPAASQLETINRILARMSDEVRYTGMELGEGGLIPRTPAETLKRRFGDCKDKAVLLTALLRAADIPAYVALLNAGEDDQDVEESLPGFGLFNHAIVVVPGAPAIWIDPTDPYARAGELPVSDQGRRALVASVTATGLVRTPESTSGENRQVETREVFLADLGPSRIVETSEYQGAIERDVRSLYSLQDGQTVRQALKDYATAAYLAEDLAGVEHSKAADLSVPMRLRIEVKNARRGFTDERTAAVGVIPAALLNRLPDELTASDDGGKGGPAEPRRADYVFSRPMTIEVRYRIVPPVGYAPQPLPAPRVRHLGSATLAEEYAAGADNVVTATFRLDTGKRRISPKELEALRSGVREALQDKVSLLLFDQVGEAHLNAGRVREALAEFQRLAAMEPKKALPRTRIARALLAGGMGEAAREEARRALLLDPKLAIAHRNLGWILQHDELGRRFGPGFDRAAAIAAYRKARELDPKDPITRADLAILLEHDDHGLRYGPHADLGAAIDEYKALKKDLAAKTVDDNLLIALVRAGRFPEAKELAAQMKDSQTASLFSLVATAAIDGVDAAVREGERAFSDDKARAAALQSAAQSLTLARRYPEAAALMERASRQSDNPAAMLSMADSLRRARRHEEIVLPADQPATPARRLMTMTTAEKLDVKQLASLFSSDLQPGILKAGDQAQRLFEAGAAPARRQLRSQQVPWDVAIDFALGALQETVSGNADSGYRVGLSFPFEKNGQDFTVYVVPDGGEYRIAGLSTAVSMLGEEALRRVQRGDLAGARKWLDWAREEVGGDTGAGSGDPIPQNPFPALWAQGSAGSAEDVRCAAAALLATSKESSARALPLLRVCREAAGEPARRNAFDVALALGDAEVDRFADMEETSRRLLAAAPGSERAEKLHAQALVALGRWVEIRALAERRLQRSADDPWALQLLVSDALHAQDLDQAEARLRQIVKSGKATANNYNQLAWLLLERGRVDDEALDFGQRAATLSDYKQWPALHTLACLYAEKGRTAEAYRIILQSIGAKPDETPGADDWYVFGRLAEQYGLPDVARKYYRKVTAPKSLDTEPMSTHALATRRLGALGEEKKPQRRAAL
jgi:tetratricopeptide (TPR) repeat protein/transglutaminase-like putative cysteine protease